jgi:hypothetical protein
MQKPELLICRFVALPVEIFCTDDQGSFMPGALVKKVVETRRHVPLRPNTHLLSDQLQSATES